MKKTIKQAIGVFDSGLGMSPERRVCFEDIYALDKYVEELIEDSELDYNNGDQVLREMFEYVLELHKLTNMMQPAIPLGDFSQTLLVN